MPTANNKNHITTLKILTIDFPLFREAITSWALTSIGGTSRKVKPQHDLGTQEGVVPNKKKVGGYEQLYTGR